MYTGTRHARQLAAGAVAALLLAGAAVSTAGAVTTVTADPFTHIPEELQCNASSAYVILSVDTAKITTPTNVVAVVYLDSDIGTFGSSPSPLTFPGSGSIYWTIPFTDLGSAHITWSLLAQAGGAYIDSGTVDFDFTGICDTTPSSPPTSTVAPSPAVEAVAAVAVDPQPVVAAAVAASPAVTG